MNKAIALVLLAILFLSGCMQSKNMIPQEFTVAQKQPFSVKAVISGECTKKWCLPQFPQALNQSLAKSQVFNAIVLDGKSDFILSVEIENVSMNGFADTETKITAVWTLQNTATKQVMWNNAIATSCSVSAANALISEDRMTKSQEGAARENIKEGIKQLSMLELE